MSQACLDGSKPVRSAQFEAWGSFGKGGPPATGGGGGGGGANGLTNLLLGLPTGGCAFDPCVADGSCAVDTNNMCGGGCAGTNGVRRCGAASS